MSLTQADRVLANGRHHKVDIGYPTEWELIDPELAALYLTCNTHNRKKNRRVVAQYAAKMRRGEWQANGDTIRFSVEDVLLNGQHTLEAIVESNTKQLCLVVRGLPPEVFQTIDKQQRRRDDHDLHRAGFPNSTTLCSCIRLLWAYECYRQAAAPPEQRLTSEQLIAIASAIPQLSTATSETGWSARILTPQIGAAIWFATRGTPDKRDEFFGVLRGDIPATRRHPAFQLRERFRMETGRTKRTSSTLAVALSFKAWSLHYEGREVGTLKMAENESFPLLKGYGDELTATFPEWVPQVRKKGGA